MAVLWRRPATLAGGAVCILTTVSETERTGRFIAHNVLGIDEPPKHKGSKLFALQKMLASMVVIVAKREYSNINTLLT